ncbi:MAG: PPC domain-containing DNA-binding protein, partial [Bryobacteraceae bacterium]
MRATLCLLALGVLALAMPLAAQPARTEVTKATTPLDDSKPNSDQVPEVYAINGQFERMVVLRFKHQADLLAGLEKMVQQQKIRNAVILAGAGSLRNYHIHTVSNRDSPSRNVYTRDESAPADIVSINGYVIDGRVHAHMTLVNPDKAFGGHVEPGNRVFTFAIVT